MLRVILLNLILIHSLYASEERPCLIKPENPTLYKLAKEVNAACGWSIQNIVDASILKKCEEAALEDTGIHLNSQTDPKTLRFSDFSNSYDSSLPFYFCKNKAGHDAYSSQLIKLLTKEVEKSEREIHVQQDHQRELTLKKSDVTPLPRSKKAKQWRCRVPGYRGNFRIVGEGEITEYQDVMNYECTEITP